MILPREIIDPDMILSSSSALMEGSLQSSPLPSPKMSPRGGLGNARIESLKRNLLSPRGPNSFIVQSLPASPSMGRKSSPRKKKEKAQSADGYHADGYHKEEQGIPVSLRGRSVTTSPRGNKSTASLSHSLTFIPPSISSRSQTSSRSEGGLPQSLRGFLRQAALNASARRVSGEKQLSPRRGSIKLSPGQLEVLTRNVISQQSSPRSSRVATPLAGSPQGSPVGSPPESPRMPLRSPRKKEHSHQDGIDFHGVDTYGYTPSHWAAYLGYPDVITMLLNRDSSCVNDTDPYGLTPLHIACLMGHHNVVTILISKGNPKVKDLFNRTALHYAALSGSRDCIDALLTSRKDICNLQDNFGRTALHWAVRKGYWECVELLLALGADTTLKDSDENTPLMLARLNEDTDMIKLLNGENY